MSHPRRTLLQLRAEGARRLLRGDLDAAERGLEEVLRNLWEDVREVAITHLARGDLRRFRASVSLAVKQDRWPAPAPELVGPLAHQHGLGEPVSRVRGLAMRGNGALRPYLADLHGADDDYAAAVDGFRQLGELGLEGTAHMGAAQLRALALRSRAVSAHPAMPTWACLAGLAREAGAAGDCFRRAGDKHAEARARLLRARHSGSEVAMVDLDVAHRLFIEVGEARGAAEAALMRAWRARRLALRIGSPEALRYAYGLAHEARARVRPLGRSVELQRCDELIADLALRVGREREARLLAESLPQSPRAKLLIRVLRVRTWRRG